jgi:predicted DNA-binding protein (MmcQ/YjbR family)
MKKDISFLPVEGVKVAIARREVTASEYEWHAYILNRNDQPLTNVFVTSKGYGFNGEEKQETSTLRHLIEEVEANGFNIIEKIDPAIFHLSNEYWISYFIDNQVYDKKFVFVAGSITDDNLIKINQINLEGVLHE